MTALTYRSLGALVVAAMAGWVAFRAGMSAIEVGVVTGLTGAGLHALAGHKFWS